MKEIVEIRDLATVITNLLSAIPWVGTDLVEFSHLLLISLFILAILPTIGTVVLRFFVELYLVLKMISDIH
jgi:hypothetical protein